MKYILIKDLPPVFIPAPDKEVFVIDGKVYINPMQSGFLGTLDDCLASGFVQAVKEKKKVTVWQNFYKSKFDNCIYSGRVYNSFDEAPIHSESSTDIYFGTFPTEIEVEE